MIKRTEQEIMKNWKYMEPPLVSVCCITYNHEPYIRDSIEGFLMQETDFPFEVIIHDDASTDRTTGIVREYVELYAKIIKPIYQTENQYSKGLWSFSFFNEFVLPKARGEFIALCEGDDYWTDTKKLQIQIEEMKKHPQCDLSFHPANVKYDAKPFLNTLIGYHGKNNTVISPQQAVSTASAYCATASILMRNQVFKSMPKWIFNRAPVIDTFFRIFGAERGGALYINKIMSLTNRNVPGSWHQRIRDGKILKDKSVRYQYCMKKIKKRMQASFVDGINQLQANDKFALARYYLKNREYIKYKRNIILGFSLFPETSLSRKIAYWSTCSAISMRVFAIFYFFLCRLKMYLKN